MYRYIDTYLYIQLHFPYPIQNGILDCLRVIPPPHYYVETVDEKNKRLAAQWDTQCAFEAEYNWMKMLRDVHDINNLVDDTGDIVERDFGTIISIYIVIIKH